MIRLKLFGLMLAFALLALVRPKKILEMLDAADAGVRAKMAADLIARQNARIRAACSLAPPGWYCTRGAGHDGPCAAVPDHPSPGPL